MNWSPLEPAKCILELVTFDSTIQRLQIRSKKFFGLKLIILNLLMNENLLESTIEADAILRALSKCKGIRI